MLPSLPLVWPSNSASVRLTEMTAIRRSLEPVIRRICDIWLVTHGFKRSYTILWDDINLQDAEGDAHAELYRAQAEYYKRQAGKTAGKEVLD